MASLRVAVKASKLHAEAGNVDEAAQKDPKVKEGGVNANAAFYADDVPEGWKVYAMLDESKTTPVVFYVTPKGKKLKSIVDVQRYLDGHPQQWQQLDGEGIQLGATIEAELENDDGSVEWVRGPVTKIFKKGSSFEVFIQVNNAKEKGEWTEKYTMKERGKEWRFPNLTGADFEALAESARGTCHAAVQQSSSKSPAHQQAPKQGPAKKRKSIQAQDQDESKVELPGEANLKPGQLKVGGYIVEGSKVHNLVQRNGGIDTVSENKLWLQIAQDVGVDTSEVSRIPYLLKRAYTIYISKQGSQSGQIMSQRGGPKQASGPGSSRDAKQPDVGPLVAVGDVIEAEMDDSEKGTLEWLLGTVTKVNAKKLSFVANFRIQNATEQGDWDETYRMDEEGKEWRRPGASPAKKSHKAKSKQAQTDVQEDTEAKGKTQGNGKRKSKSGEVEDRIEEAEIEAPALNVRSRDSIEGRLDLGGKEVWMAGVVARVDRQRGTFTVLFGDEENDEEVLKAKFHGEDENETWRFPDKASLVESAPPKSKDSKKIDYGLFVGAEIEVLIEEGKGKSWTFGEVTKINSKNNCCSVLFDGGPGDEAGWTIDMSIDECEWRWAKKGSGKKSGGNAEFAKEVQGVAEPKEDYGEPYVGAKVQVLFSEGGEELWWGGKITRHNKKEEPQTWHVVFDDGEEDDVVIPCLKNEIRVISKRKVRSAGGKSKKDSHQKAIHVGCLVKVLFEEDGESLKYTGKVVGRDPETNLSTIRFEDGEEHVVELPDGDVELVSFEEEWNFHENALVNKLIKDPIPWWCATPCRHALEPGEFDIELPEELRSKAFVSIPPFKKERKPRQPKGQKGKAGSKTKPCGTCVNCVSLTKKHGCLHPITLDEGQQGGTEQSRPANEGDKIKKSKKEKEQPAQKEDTEVKRDEEKAKKKKQEKEARKKEETIRLDDDAGAIMEREAKPTKKKVQRGESSASAHEQQLTAARKLKQWERAELSKIILQPQEDDVDIIEDTSDFVDALCVFLEPGQNICTKDFCVICGSSSDRDDMIVCRDCGDTFHVYCFDQTLRIPPEKQHMWRCPVCRICETCNGEENWDQMLVCDECDRGFHMYCLKPALKQIPAGGWRCTECIRCLSCGSKTPGPNSKCTWRRDCTLCEPCGILYARGNFCPMCKKVFQADDRTTKMVTCDSCQKWVHIQCGNIDSKRYEQMMESTDDIPWECPKCKGEIEVSDDEETFEERFPLAGPERVLDLAQQVGEFCQARLKLAIAVVNEIQDRHRKEDDSSECIKYDAASQVAKETTDRVPVPAANEVALFKVVTEDANGKYSQGPDALEESQVVFRRDSVKILSQKASDGVGEPSSQMLSSERSSNEMPSIKDSPASWPRGSRSIDDLSKDVSEREMNCEGSQISALQARLGSQENNDIVAVAETSCHNIDILRTASSGRAREANDDNLLLEQKTDHSAEGLASVQGVSIVDAACGVLSTHQQPPDRKDQAATTSAEELDGGEMDCDALQSASSADALTSDALNSTDAPQASTLDGCREPGSSEIRVVPSKEQPRPGSKAPLTPIELAGFNYMRKGLKKIERDLEKHKFVRTVQFVDDLLELVTSEYIKSCIPEQSQETFDLIVQQLGTCAFLCPMAQLPPRLPKILNKKRVWAIKMDFGAPKSTDDGNITLSEGPPVVKRVAKPKDPNRVSKKQASASSVPKFSPVAVSLSESEQAKLAKGQEFLKVVRDTYQSIPAVYINFMHTLSNYQSQKCTVDEAVDHVEILFKEHPELFQRFLGFVGPNSRSSRASATSPKPKSTSPKNIAKQDSSPANSQSECYPSMAKESYSGSISTSQTPSSFQQPSQTPSSFQQPSQTPSSFQQPSFHLHPGQSSMLETSPGSQKNSTSFQIQLEQKQAKQHQLNQQREQEQVQQKQQLEQELKKIFQQQQQQNLLEQQQQAYLLAQQHLQAQQHQDRLDVDLQAQRHQVHSSESDVSSSAQKRKFSQHDVGDSSDQHQQQHQHQQLLLEAMAQLPPQMQNMPPHQLQSIFVQALVLQQQHESSVPINPSMFQQFLPSLGVVDLDPPKLARMPGLTLPQLVQGGAFTGLPSIPKVSHGGISQQQQQVAQMSQWQSAAQAGASSSARAQQQQILQVNLGSAAGNAAVMNDMYGAFLQQHHAHSPGRSGAPESKSIGQDVRNLPQADGVDYEGNTPPPSSSDFGGAHGAASQIGAMNGAASQIGAMNCVESAARHINMSAVSAARGHDGSFEVEVYGKNPAVQLLTNSGLAPERPSSSSLAPLEQTSIIAAVEELTSSGLASQATEKDEDIDEGKRPLEDDVGEQRQPKKIKSGVTVVAQTCDDAGKKLPPEGVVKTVRVTWDHIKSKPLTDDFDFYIPAKLHINPVKKGILDRKIKVRKCAMVAQQLWITTLMEAANKGENLVIRKHVKKMKKKMMEGWNFVELARLIESRAICLGRIRIVNGEARLTEKMMPRHLIHGKEALVAQAQQLPKFGIRAGDTRNCALCNIMGDCPVQGRLLFVELGVWAHINCLCWSYGVYEDTLAKKLGKYGMLCNVHSVIREASKVFCDYCGCPGATIMCSAPGCQTATHFGCAQLSDYLFYPENHIFCSGCRDHPLVERFGGASAAMPPWQMVRTSARHLRVMPRPKPVPTFDKKSQHQSVSKKKKPGKGGVTVKPPAVKKSDATIGAEESAIEEKAAQPQSEIKESQKDISTPSQPTGDAYVQNKPLYDQGDEPMPDAVTPHAPSISVASSSLQPLSTGNNAESVGAVGVCEAKASEPNHADQGTDVDVHGNFVTKSEAGGGQQSPAKKHHAKVRDANMTPQEQAAAEALKRDKERQRQQEQMLAAQSEEMYAQDLEAYDNNQDRDIAKRLQEGKVVARVGSLTVQNLGRIKSDDDLFHSELAIYPVGYQSTRLYFAPGMVPTKGGGAIRRCLYHCEIMEDPKGSGPLFCVTVNGQCYTSKMSSDAWERATARPLRERKKLKVHANEGQCDNVTEMFMACSYAVDGDYMFGVTIGPVAKALEALQESLLLFNYHPRFDSSSVRTRINPSGCARAEPFKRKKKMSTAKVMRTTGQDDDQTGAEPMDGREAQLTRQHEKPLRQMYERLRADPRTIMRRSPIHNLGLFATAKIQKDDMVIEYVGEICREEVADLRDNLALEQGKSTYMFRLDENTIVDAMFQGNESRFINHSCEPNCYSKVVTIEGMKHIIMFAGRDIAGDDEITYDYKLPIEDVKIPCHCGASQCRGYLN